MSLAFLAPQFLWALLALPVVLLLHFLRTRRRARVVSALFLWRQARQAAESRRRFSPTWLLILQLLFAGLAALALARPAVSFEGPPDRVLVIDASASMLARDDTVIRLERAVDQAAQLLEGGGRVAIVRAGLDARVAAPLTAERAELNRALQGIRAGDRHAELRRAVDLGRSLVPDGEVHLFTDGPLPPGGDYLAHRLIGDGLNYGITTFDTGIGQAYVAVSSNDPRPQQLQLELHRADQVIASTSLLVPGEGQGNVTFPLEGPAGLIEARIITPGSDSLAIDDVAFAGQPELQVTVEGESGPLLRALEALPATEMRAPLAGSDVRVLFGPLPEELPEGNILSFAAAAEEPEYRTVRDWAQGDDLFRFVDLRETVVGLAPGAEQPSGEGWETLARTADLRPVISRYRGEGRTIIRVAFHPSQTDMVLRPAFPAFIANVMNSFRGEAVLPLGAALPEGSSIDGREVSFALEPAVYETPAGPVAASLLSAAETQLPAPDADVTSPSDRGAPLEVIEASRGLWLLMVVLALAILLLEWVGWSRGGVGWLRG